MGVYLCSGQVCVTEQFLDYPDVSPVIQQVCGEAVAEYVGTFLGNFTCPGQVVLDDSLNGTWIDALSAGGEKNRFTGVAVGTFPVKLRTQLQVPF